MNSKGWLATKRVNPLNSYSTLSYCFPLCSLSWDCSVPAQSCGEQDCRGEKGSHAPSRLGADRKIRRDRLFVFEFSTAHTAGLALLGPH